MSQKQLLADCQVSLSILLDVTGSMRSNPSDILREFQTLSEEIARYCPNHQVSICAFGDARCDKHPLQIRAFAKSNDLKKELEAIIPEGGGGDDPESHGLPAYFYLNDCDISGCVKSILIFITDTTPHEIVTKDEIQNYIGSTVSKDFQTDYIMRQLAEKFSTYVLLRGYDKKSETNKYWEKIFGGKKVIDLGNPRDIVELIIGIVAREQGALKDFTGRLEERCGHDKEKLTRVMTSMLINPLKLTEDTFSTNGGTSTNPSGRQLLAPNPLLNIDPNDPSRRMSRKLDQ